MLICEIERCRPRATMTPKRIPMPGPATRNASRTKITVLLSCSPRAVDVSNIRLLTSRSSSHGFVTECASRMVFSSRCHEPAEGELPLGSPPSICRR